MGLFVRRAEPQDAPAVARVHVASWRQAYRGLLPQEYLDSLSVEARTTSRAKALSQLPDQTPTTLIGELDGQIVGFASVGPSRDDETDTATGELWGLYLDPAHWGVGHGHALHTEALDVARASGAAAATLWVLTTNQRARHFYERQGWAADGAVKTVWRGDVRLDETRYRISLGRDTDTGAGTLTP
jgi:ribosomal protein S18 acetylase RimI-like enzyme